MFMATAEPEKKDYKKVYPNRLGHKETVRRTLTGQKIR